MVYRIAKSRFQSNTNTWQSKSNRCRLLFNFQKSKSDTIAEYSSNIEYPKKQIFLDNFWPQGQFFFKCQIQKYFTSNISFKIARIKSKSVKTLKIFLKCWKNKFSFRNLADIYQKMGNFMTKFDCRILSNIEVEYGFQSNIFNFEKSVSNGSKIVEYSSNMRFSNIRVHH